MCVVPRMEERSPFWDGNESKLAEGLYSLIVRHATSSPSLSSPLPNTFFLFQNQFQARKNFYFSLFPQTTPTHFFPEEEQQQQQLQEENETEKDSFLSMDGIEGRKLKEFGGRLEEEEGEEKEEQGVALLLFLQFYLVVGKRIAEVPGLSSSAVPSSSSSSSSSSLPSCLQSFWLSFLSPLYETNVGRLEGIVHNLIQKKKIEEDGEAVMSGNELMFCDRIQRVMRGVLELEVSFLRSFDSLLPSLPLAPTTHYTTLEMVVDFDGTITTEQTTSILPLLSLEKRGRSQKEAEEEWEKMGENYFCHYNRFFSSALPPSPSSTIFEFLEKYDEFEDQAYDPVEESLSLSHLSLDDVKASALALCNNTNMSISSPSTTNNSNIRPGCLSGLQKMFEKATSLSIISLNWSQEFVEEVISLSFFPSSPFPPNIQVLSNCLFPPSPSPSLLSTGKLTRKVTTSKEKVVFSFHPNSLKIAIGDSLNDLSALLSSDIPIILKNHQTKKLSGSFSRVCHAYGVILLPLFACSFPSCRFEHTIYVAEGWEELCVWWGEWQKNF